MRSLLSLLVFAVIATACTGDDQPADPDSGIAGIVLVGSCPVGGPEGPPCGVEPVGDVRLVVQDLEGKQVAEGRSEEDGAFRIPLEPGKYILLPKDAPPPALDIEKPIEFRVRAGGTTRLRVVLDTGVQ